MFGDDQIGWFDYVKKHWMYNRHAWHAYLVGKNYPLRAKFCFDEGNEMIFNLMFGNHAEREPNQRGMYLKFIEMLFNPWRTTNIIRGDSRPVIKNARSLMVHTPGIIADSGRATTTGQRFLPDLLPAGGMTYGHITGLTYGTIVFVVVVVVLLCWRRR